MATTIARPVPPRLTPCAACPWRTANHLKKHKFGFYTKKNLTRLWRGLRTGNSMSCHPTDPSHPDHLACGTSPDATVRECAGAVILVLREMGKVAAHAADKKTIGPEELDAYWAERKKGFNRAGALYWLVQRLGFGGVPFFGDRVLPAVNEKDKRISLPTFLEG